MIQSDSSVKDSLGLSLFSKHAMKSEYTEGVISFRNKTCSGVIFLCVSDLLKVESMRTEKKTQRKVRFSVRVSKRLVFICVFY